MTAPLIKSIESDPIGPIDISCPEYPIQFIHQEDVKAPLIKSIESDPHRSKRHDPEPSVPDLEKMEH